MCKVLLISEYFMNVGLGQFVKNLSLDNNLTVGIECIYICLSRPLIIHYLFPVCIRVYMYICVFVCMYVYICMHYVFLFSCYMYVYACYWHVCKDVWECIK